MRLTADQEDKILRYLNLLSTRFEKEMSDRKWIKERKERHQTIRELLSKENIERLTEPEFRELYKSLWAINGWNNKDWVVDNLIKNNGFIKIRNSLGDLLYGTGTLQERFDRFNVKGIGTSSITEILAFVDPNKYSLWNEKPRRVFPLLGIDQIPKKVYKYSQIDGSEYTTCNDVMKEMRDLLTRNGFKEINLLDLDLFIWLIFSESQELLKGKKRNVLQDVISSKKMISVNTSEMTHWDAIGILVELGNTLGYRTYVADPSKKYKEKTLGELASSKDVPEQCKNIPGIERIDVIWFSFEPPFHLFEVEDKGTMREALHRLYQARFFESRFIIVSPLENKEKFEKYVTTDPFKSIRKKYLFRSFDDLMIMYNAALRYTDERTRFFGE